MTLHLKQRRCLTATTTVLIPAHMIEAGADSPALHSAAGALMLIACNDGGPLPRVQPTPQSAS